MDVEGRREERIEHDSRVSGLNNWVDGTFILKRKEQKRNGKFGLKGLMSSVWGMLNLSPSQSHKHRKLGK